MGIKIDTGAIASAAARMSSLNESLADLMNETRQQMDSLAGSWSGAAADATIQSYDAFAAKYSEEYHKLIDDYVKFLNQVAAANYETVEQQNTSLSDALL